MALYAIGDTHLSLSVDKPMDVFGGGWEGYVDKLREGFSAVAEEDTVVLCGRHFLGMSLEEAEPDFGVSQQPCRAEMAAQGQPRLLVDHRRKIPCLLCGQRADHAGAAA